MVKQVQERPIQWLVSKEMQLKKELCQEHSIKFSKVLKLIQSKHSFWLEQVIWKFIMRRSEIYLVRTQRINLNLKRSLILEYTSKIWVSLQWKELMRLMMCSRLEWKIDQWVQLIWMQHLVDLILCSRLQSKDLKLELTESNILEQVNLTWSIWLVLRESPKQELLEIDSKKQLRLICLFLHFVMLFQLLRIQRQPMFHTETQNLLVFFKIL